jgi:hypothetical protein
LGMPTRAMPISPWNAGKFAVADAGVLIGRALRVYGLDDALTAVAEGRRSLPDVVVEAMDAELDRWVYDLQRRGEKWDFVVRDVDNDRWVQLSGAFVARYDTMRRRCVLAINGAAPTDGPGE